MFHISGNFRICDIDIGFLKFKNLKVLNINLEEFIFSKMAIFIG
jgi:hypothetical protein